jgi:hypothetical protein
MTMKKKAQRRVFTIEPLIEEFRFHKMEDWAQVIVIPEVSKMTVFKSGRWKGLRGRTPVGGHVEPNSTGGLREKKQ